MKKFNLEMMVERIIKAQYINGVQGLITQLQTKLKAEGTDEHIPGGKNSNNKGKRNIEDSRRNGKTNGPYPSNQKTD